MSCLMMKRQPRLIQRQNQRLKSPQPQPTVMIEALVTAVIMGLMGSGHCIVMCGGLASAFGYQVSAWQLLSYNLGRISSYVCAGALVGYLSSNLALLTPHHLMWLRALAGLFMIALGLYIGGWWRGLASLEKLGKPLWRRLQPLALRLRNPQQPRRSWRTFAAGMVWGWLPCGLVYAALSWSALQGNGAHGAWLMFAFGMGTLPAMFSLGVANRWFAGIVQQQGVRFISGWLLILYGCWTALVVIRHALS